MAVFYKYEYTNKWKNIHPCIILDFSESCIGYYSHFLGKEMSSINLKPPSISQKAINPAKKFFFHKLDAKM